MALRFITLLVLPLSVLLAQSPLPLEPFGLEGKQINDLRIHGSFLYAAADTDGVYVRNIASPDSAWRSMGLVGKKVNAVYPHDVGPLGPFVLTVGVSPDPESDDTTRIYCWTSFAQSWVPSDTAIPFSELREVISIDGFPDIRVCGETFAVGSNKVYRNASGGWEKVFEGEFGVNVVHTGNGLWIGGDGGFNPSAFTARSVDVGETWDINFVSGGVGNVVLSIEDDRTGIMYAGLRDLVVRSDDSGKTWYDPTVCDIEIPPAWWKAVETNRARDGHVIVGGALIDDGSFVMIESVLGGTCWSVYGSDSLSGISSIIQDPCAEGVFYAATMGTGVLRFTSTIVKVGDGEKSPGHYVLLQNYPNPFNPSTTIRYELSSRTDVVLKIFDVLGQEVATLVDEEKSAGRYEVSWDAGRIASGIYFYRLQARDFVQTKKLVLLR